jgi:ketosteroid isomerase-like protein
MTLLIKLPCILLFLPLLAFGQTDYKADVDIIRASRAASNNAIARHDIEGMAKYWLSDFTQTIGRGITTVGRDSVSAGWGNLFKTNQTVSYIRTPENIIVGDNGIMAWESGHWDAINSYSKGGNYSAMWRKINGDWKLQAELFVSLRKL